SGIYPRTYYIFGMLIVAVVVFLAYLVSLPITSRATTRLEMQRFHLNRSNYVNSRFQAFESRRSHRMLRYYIPFQVGTLLTILATATGLTVFLVPSHPSYFLLIQQSAYFLFFPRAIISMLIALLMHPSLRNTVKQILRERDDSNEVPSSTTKHVPVKSLSGNPLNFAAGNQSDMYFQ
ncbi:hypothetical protein PMAYCL1PPCAC_16125, partial [Pristionchus mayeri]